MKFICPLVVVDDIEKSRFLYESLLNQEVKTDFGENVTYKGGFSIHQKKHFCSLIKKKDIIQKSNSFELYFEEDDLEPVVVELKKLGFEFVHELQEQPWRQKVVRFYDYDKNMIEIGERMEHVAYRLSLEGKSLKQISKITYLPEHIVENSIIEYGKLDEDV